jgi:hypothetical protein
VKRFVSSGTTLCQIAWFGGGRAAAVRSQWETETLVRDGKLVVLLND